MTTLAFPEDEQNTMRKHKPIPNSLEDAVEMNVEAAAKLRRPAKVMADLMGVELKTYYRWLADTSMPLNRVRQFEAFCGASFVSDYLCTAAGNRVVIPIATGKRAAVGDVADVQANAAAAMALLARFYVDGVGTEETLAAMTRTLSEFAYHRQNVMKTGQPELELFGE